MKTNKKQLEIIKSLCINTNDSNDYYKFKLNNIIPHIRFNNSKKNENNKIINFIHNKKYDELFNFYKKDYSSLYYLIIDIFEMIENNKIIISKKIKIKFNELLFVSENINDGLCPIEYIKFTIDKTIENYDSKNFINHIKHINKENKKYILINNIKKDKTLFYFLKKEKNIFNIIFNILENNNSLFNLQNSIYQNNCGFNPDNDISEALSNNSISQKDKFESNNFLQFKTCKREDEEINDSLLFKKFLLTNSNKHKEIDKIIKKNKLSSYATILMLEHIFYISESLINNVDIDEKYLEKCLISLYNGDAKNINEKLV